MGAIMSFQAALRDRIDRIRSFIDSEILAKWSTNRRARGPGERADATGRHASPWIEAKLRHLKADLEHDSPTPIVEAAAYGVRTQNWKNQVRLIPESLRKDPHIGPQIDTFRKAALDRITALDSETVDELRGILEDAETSGLKAQDLRDQIQERLGVSESKADLLARDQSLKLNAAITQERQTASGISEYIWSGSLDERERETHYELEGTTQRWDDPPVTNEDGDTNHPGTDYQCRCVAIPIIPDLPSGDEDDE